VKLIITGFSNSGKTTVFNALTGLDVKTTTYPESISSGGEQHTGIVNIPDTRLDTLSSVYSPKKTTFATVAYSDFPGITPASGNGDVSQNIKVFNLIRDADAIVHVVRAFEDESVVHPMKGVDPKRDVSSFEDELILGDLVFVEKRLEKIDEQGRKGRKPDEADRQLLLKCRKKLEDEISLRDCDFTDEEKRLVLQYQFLTTIPEIIVLNVDEHDIHSDKVKNLQNEIEGYFKAKTRGSVPPVIVLCGKIEMEIAQLPPDEGRAFLEDLGIRDSAMLKLCRTSYNALGLISFFTVGKDEVKAWTIKAGTPALVAAGKIHSDIERGFIRAEVVGFDDYRSADFTMGKARERGLVRLEGKTYVVQDGDIINFKFNV
jgi:GTP-binding protein YchF